MKDVPLSEFLGTKTFRAKQKEVARALGITQSAVSQMARSGRRVFVRVIDGQVVGAFEIKAVPSNSRISLPASCCEAWTAGSADLEPILPSDSRL
ncbi:Cro/CI family transcriptional regulator, partial [Pseudomonas aeruginosa]|uniref:Cro/CI family transcriptional regulator n=6 Tax=Pseudomonas aeruginosa TaxID=287 RepID=UPI0035F4FE35